MMLLDTDPYTSVTMSINNIDGALDSLNEIVKFEVKPPDMYSNLNLFYDAQCYVWRYMLCANGGKKLCTGTLTDEHFEQVFEQVVIYSELNTKTEREYGHLVNALTNLLGEDFTMKERAEDVVGELVYGRIISSTTGDSIISMLNGRDEC
jgi:hypothetical protein